MRLYEPLIRAHHVVAPAGRSLETSDVDELRKHCPDLEIRILDPQRNEKLPFERGQEDRQVAHAVQTRIVESMGKADQQYAERTSLTGVDLDEMSKAVLEVLDFIAQHPGATAQLARSLDTESYLSDRTCRVLYTAMMLAAGAQDILAERLRPHGRPPGGRDPVRCGMVSLGLGVLFMDSALADAPEIIHTDRTLTYLEWDRVWVHPIEGTAQLTEEFPAMVRAVVRTHHENHAGTGFPDRLPGARVPALSRIVRIADAFETATATGTYSRARSPVRTLWEMTHGPYRKHFDPELTAAFVRLIHPFPIGARIQLEDGRYAIVVRLNRSDPFQPIGVIAFDSEGRRLPSRRLKDPTPLGPDSGVRLKSFQGEDLLYLYGVGSDRDNDHQADTTETLFKLLYP